MFDKNCASPMRSLPACPQLKRNLADPSHSISFIKDSSFSFHAAETDGKNPHLFLEPNLDEPSLRRDLAFIPVMDIQDTFVVTPAYLNNLYVREGKDTNIFETGNIMLLDTSNMTRHHVDEYMAENNIFPHQILEVTTMDLLIEFAKIGLGIACVIKELVQKELDSGMLVEIPLDIPIHRRTIGFAYHPANQAMALKTFLEFLY